jgi:CheY-like chemotaxis protein
VSVTASIFADDDTDSAWASASAPSASASEASPRVWLVLDVRDSGCGIAASELPQLFRPYSQLLSGLRRSGGTGLGLSLSRTLCARCGGNLSCASAAGEGSVFTARIPYALGEALPEAGSAGSAGGTPARGTPAPSPASTPLRTRAAAAAGAAAAAAAAGVAAGLTPPPSPFRAAAASAPASPAAVAFPSLAAPAAAAAMASAAPRVLVVDDSPLNRMVLVKLLGAMGVAADSAASGQAGVDAVLGAAPGFNPYVLVFMDQEMPGGLCGHAATRAIRAAGVVVPIVALTGNALSDDRDAFFAAGCADFLTKPVTREQLAAVLAAHAGMSHLRT